MNRATVLAFWIILISILCLSACNRRNYGVGGLGLSGTGVGGGGVSSGTGFGLGAAGGSKAIAVSPQTIARYAVMENYFQNIADLEDLSEAMDNINEVLMRCVSPEVLVLIYSNEEMDTPAIENTIRNYMDMLLESRVFEERINEITYDTRGNITSFSMVKLNNDSDK